MAAESPAPPEISRPPQRTSRLRQIADVDPEHVVDVEARPDGREVLDTFRKRLLPRGQIRGVDASGRHTGEDSRHDVGKLSREDAQEADLVGTARAPAAQDKGQVSIGSG